VRCFADIQYLQLHYQLRTWNFDGHMTSKILSTPDWPDDAQRKQILGVRKILLAVERKLFRQPAEQERRSGCIYLCLTFNPAIKIKYFAELLDARMHTY
jgi:hypothetical protein